MVEKVTKAKAPAKPVAAAAKSANTATKSVANTATKKVAVAQGEAARTPSHAEIAQLAHHYWIERGHPHGSHEQDWLRAEKELKKKS
jgi:hypothetical protein